MPDQLAAKAEDKPEAKAEPKPEPPPERESVTEGKVRGIPYRATAATYHLKDRDDESKVKASLFHVAYVRTDVKDPSARPVTFAFNGGPGSSSVWLHLGLFGPRRVVIGEAPVAPPPPYRAVENEHTILDDSDLVMIDPVTTGWSRAVPGEDAKQFHGLKEDTESVAEFIRLWLSRNGRWESPKFLMGESYGTTRASALAGHLTDKLGIYINGIVLISAILLFIGARPDTGNDLPFVLILPTYAATAWYHRVLDRRRWRSVKALADEVEAFALGEYASVLLRGSRAGAGERRDVLERLACYTGLSERFIEACDMRVPPHRFFKELLREQRRTVGRLDSRFLGIDRDAAGEAPEYDPAYAVIQGIYTAAVNHYLRVDLKFDNDALYDVISEKVRPWKWGEPDEAKFPEVGSALRGALSRSPGTRVLLASGYYDLATPFAAAEWTFDHIQLDPALRDNVTMKRYEAGHMMYIHEPSIRQLRADLRAFMKAALP
ncbi:MAG TPA: peptidase S10 [Candidatus Dormibacteraeota bacterium]